LFIGPRTEHSEGTYSYCRIHLVGKAPWLPELRRFIEKRFSGSAFERSMARHIDSCQPLTLETERAERRYHRSRPFVDIDELLVVNQATARPFRKEGPIAADFGSKNVCPRYGPLERLRNLVLGQPASVFCGDSGSGKTVLIRKLAYDLHNENRAQLYYLTGDDWTSDELAESVIKADPESIFVFDDIHLRTVPLQDMYTRVRNRISEKHLLFVGQPSFKNNEQNSVRAKLSDLPSETVQAFEDIDELIQHFSAQPEYAALRNRAVQDTVLASSKDNMWLLSYALLGCSANKGRGDPAAWLSDGVRRDLSDLAASGKNELLPRAVVVLSLLFRYEVPTEARFMCTFLGCEKELFDALANRGEIIPHTSSTGYVLYGLPHRSLAEAYWRYGQEYAKWAELPQEKDFLLQYVKADVPNGISAIRAFSAETRDWVLRQLTTDEKAVSRIIEDKKRRGELVVKLHQRGGFQLFGTGKAVRSSHQLVMLCRQTCLLGGCNKATEAEIKNLRCNLFSNLLYSDVIRLQIQVKDIFSVCVLDCIADREEKRKLLCNRKVCVRLAPHCPPSLARSWVGRPLIHVIG